MKPYGLHDSKGRLYATTFFDPNSDRKELHPPDNAVELTAEINEAIGFSPILLMDYTVKEGVLVHDAAFVERSPDSDKPKEVRQLRRVASPDDADVILDGDQLILQRTANDDDEQVRLTLTLPSGVPIVTLDLDEPHQIEVSGRVVAFALSGAVRTFYQRRI